jgi:hypothetical protein
MDERVSMRDTTRVAVLLFCLALAACAGIETRPTDTDEFAAGNYHYYQWRSEPLGSTTSSGDPVYLMDPILRHEVDAALQAKGYVLDPERAQFSVDYLYAAGLRMGEKSQDASNLTPYPTALPNRQVDQATVDNAYALGGVKETHNIALQFNDVQRRQEVWRVVISKIVENVNRVDRAELERNLKKAVRQGLRTLPAAD